MSKILLRINRDSVCMGDDIDDHYQEVMIEPMTDTRAFIDCVMQKYPVPYMPYDSSLWLIYLNDECIAKIMGTMTVCLSQRVCLNLNNNVYFCYSTI